ncbi:hypothetical protein [Pedobacter frigiditerrae]|uniref:hypothetical protein n=1 Tax=Pedobacter frigiditerrae TaxID=2530452 RepID=UPI00292EB599|nr:hypothetical protein [Pedobacter frigiditerrae]
MKKLLTIGILSLFFGCIETEKKSATLWKTIEFGDYIFDFPPDYKLIEENGIDSYVGKIKGNDMYFEFDFGFYSTHFEQTIEEYLKEGNWRASLPLQLMKDNITYDDTNMPKVEIINIRPVNAKDNLRQNKYDFIAECKHNKKNFNYPISIPDDIKEQNFRIDTIKNVYRKIVFSNDTKNGITGIYLAKIGGAKALALLTSNLTKDQQKTALKIFETGRLKILNK